MSICKVISYAVWCNRCKGDLTGHGTMSQEVFTSKAEAKLGIEQDGWTLLRGGKVLCNQCNPPDMG